MYETSDSVAGIFGLALIAAVVWSLITIPSIESEQECHAKTFIRVGTAEQMFEYVEGESCHDR